MKKMLLRLLSLIIILGCCGCNSQPSAPKEENLPSPESVSVTEEAPAEEKTPEDIISEATLLAVGDNLIHDVIYYQAAKRTDDGSYDFLPVYVVNILDFMMNKASSDHRVKSIFRLYEEDTHALLTDRVTFIFIALPKFNKKIEDLDGDVLEGMYFCFKNMAALEERPKVLNHRIFAKIFEVTELYNMDRNTRDKVTHKMTTERDLRNQMAYARKEAIEEGREEGLAEGRAKGLAEGLAEGRAEGRMEAKIELCKSFLAQGVLKEQVAKAAGLTIAELEALVAEQ